MGQGESKNEQGVGLAGAEPVRESRTVQVFDAAAVALLFAGMAGLLAWLGRAEPRRWTVVRALVASTPRRHRELRFAAVLAGVVTLLAAVAACTDPLRGLAPGLLALGVVVAFAPVACAHTRWGDF